MGEPIREPLDPHQVAHDHEHSDVSIRPLLVFLAFLVGSLALVTTALVVLFNIFETGAVEREPAPVPLAETDVVAPGPNLQVSPRDEMRRFRERENALLRSTAWVNRMSGVVRIPIEEAKRLTLERGLPKWPAADASGQADEGAADNSQPLPSESPATAGEDPPPGAEGGPPQ